MSNNYTLRVLAQNAGKRKFMPHRPCRRGHLSERYTSTGACIQCVLMPAKRQPIGNAWQPRLMRIPPFFNATHREALQQSVEAHVHATVRAWLLAWFPGVELDEYNDIVKFPIELDENNNPI